MRYLISSFLVAVIIVSFTAMVQADNYNQGDLNVLPLSLVTTNQELASATSPMVRIPQACKIDNMYVTVDQNVATSAADYLTVTFYRNGSAYGTLVTTGTTLTANTPSAFTPTALLLAAGDVVQAKLTKAGSGKTVTGTCLSIAYHNAN